MLSFLFVCFACITSHGRVFFLQLFFHQHSHHYTLWTIELIRSGVCIPQKKKEEHERSSSRSTLPYPPKFWRMLRSSSAVWNQFLFIWRQNGILRHQNGPAIKYPSRRSKLRGGLHYLKRRWKTMKGEIRFLKPIRTVKNWKGGFTWCFIKRQKFLKSRNFAEPTNNLHLSAFSNFSLVFLRRPKDKKVPYLLPPISFFFQQAIYELLFFLCFLYPFFCPLWDFIPFFLAYLTGILSVYFIVCRTSFVCLSPVFVFLYLPDSYSFCSRLRYLVLTPRANPKKEKYASDRNITSSLACNYFYSHLCPTYILFSSFIPFITFF